MERHPAGERARDDQVAHHRCHPGARVLLGRGEVEARRVALRLRDGGVRGRIAAQRGPRGEHVEDPEPDHRDVEGAGHDPLRVTRLLAVVRRHLETHPGPEREEQPDADRPRDEPARRREALERVDRVDRAERGVPAGEQVDVEDEQDEDLADQADRQQRGGEPDVEEGQHRDQQDHAESQPGPADGDPERVQLQAEEVGEATAQRCFKNRIRNERPVAGADAEFAAEPVTDVGVEAARGRLLPGHRDVTDREHHQHDRGEQERGRRAHALPVADDDRGVEEHGRDRGGPGDGQEQDAAEPDRVLTEFGDLGALGDVVVLNHPFETAYARKLRLCHEFLPRGSTCARRETGPCTAHGVKRLTTWLCCTSHARTVSAGTNHDKTYWYMKYELNLTT